MRCSRPPDTMPTRVAVLLISILASAASHAAVFVVAPDDEMIDTADAIVIGVVKGINSEFAVDGDIVTNIDLKIESVLKGEIDIGQTLRLRELGGAVGSRVMAVSESPSYWLDNRALIFLERDSEDGWRTLGTSLGKFDFVKDEEDRPLLVRWATSGDTSAFWAPDGHPHEEKLREARRFLLYIRRFISGPRTPPLRPRENGGYFVERVGDGELSPPYAWDPEAAATFPPSAYTLGTFRWDVFDKGGSVAFRVSGTQPGYDSIGAAQRALAAWTNDSGSNVDYRYGGTSSDRFVEDGKNTILYNSSADVPSGALAYAKWYANAVHTYKGETFYSISEGDVVVRGNISVSPKVFDEAVTHEVGHTLGFRHSDQGTPSSIDAVMKAVLSGRYGATLGPWDIDAVRTVYTSTSGSVPAVPTGLVARATSASSIAINWNAAANATSYQLQRATVISAFTTIAEISGTAFVDGGRTANTTYVYRVRAVNAAGASAFGTLDHATTVIFSDDPLIARTTVIKAIHLTQIRTAVNAVRVAAGLAQVSWTNASPAGVAIRAIHIAELRNALTPALSLLGKPAGYTDPTLTAGVIVKAAHFQELRNLTK